jgi:hypothetical protein
MRKISHSVRRAKQENFGMLTVPVRTVRTGHLSVRTGTRGSPTLMRGRSVQDMWRPQSVTRGRQFWHLWHTIGPIPR